MMNYRQMVDAAVKGGSGEKAMWASIDVTNELMEYLEYKDPATFEKFMRKSYEAMCGKHYNRYFAEEDVAKLHYTDKDGKEHHGAYWTIEQIKEATAEKKFPQGTTDWDKYVAYNYIKATLMGELNDEEIFSVAYALFFKSEKSIGIWDFYSKMLA